MKTCEGCRHLCREDAGRDRELFICNKPDFAGWPRRIIEDTVAGFPFPTAPVPAWCRNREIVGAGRETPHPSPAATPYPQGEGFEGAA